MEAKGSRAHYIDGVSEPYNCGREARSGSANAHTELRDSGTSARLTSFAGDATAATPFGPILWSGCVDSILRPGRHLLVGGVASVGSWRRETERFRRKGERGPEEVAERPSQVATEVIPHPVLYRMVYDLGRFDWAARWPMRHKTEALSEPFEIAQQLVVGPVSPRFASQRVHSV